MLWVVSQAWACQGTLSSTLRIFAHRRGKVILCLWKGVVADPDSFDHSPVLIFQVPSGPVLWLVYAHTAFTIYPLLPWPVLCLSVPILASLSSQVPTFFILSLLFSAISSCLSVSFTSSSTFSLNPACWPLHASPPSTSSLWLPFPYCPRLPFYFCFRSLCWASPGFQSVTVAQLS